MCRDNLSVVLVLIPLLTYSVRHLLIDLFVICVSLVNIFFIQVYIREGNGNPLQYSCLENPMEGGAW